MTQSPTVTAARAINPWVVLALVCIPVFVGSLDLTIVSAFLPEIIIQFGLPIESVTQDAVWIVSGYLLAYTVSMTFMGRVSDLIGRRRAFVICLIIFMIGSFVVAEIDPSAQSGLSNVVYNLLFRIEGRRPDPGTAALITVVIGRVIQALGAGAIVPVSLALVGDMFPAARRARPLGLIGAMDTLGWVLGHLYGGIMVNWFAANKQGFIDLFASLGWNLPPPDWRTLFWLNLPISVIALIGVLWALRGAQPQERSRGRFDFVGTALITGALICLVLGLGANIEISTSADSFDDIGGLPPYAVPVLIAGLVMFIGFIVVETRIRDPLFDLKLFRRRNFSAGLATNLFVGFCLMIGLLAVPILVNVRVADATALAEAALQVGILLSALTIPMALAAIPGGWLADRIGNARVAFIGLALAGVGFALIWQTWTLDVADWIIAVEMAFVGVGIGLTFSPISAAVIDTADQDKLGTASALVIIMRLLGMTISVALLSSLASARLAQLAGVELGPDLVDAYAAIDVYSRLVVQVLGEMGLIGALVCVVGLLPAMLLQTRARATDVTTVSDARARQTGD
ncbi:MAG: MFS transporter [Chloroflexota bacterium]|nr:MFS transporter [Chloroflexota bacterium]